MGLDDYFKWEVDAKTGFRKLTIIPFDTIFITEKEKLYNYSGETRKCSKCHKILPAITYYFSSGGKRVLHRYCKECESKKYGWGRIKNKELINIGYKYCSTCDRILPLNQVYFDISKGRCNTLSGFQSNCKECMGSSFGIKNINELKHILDIKEGYKICNTCLLEIPDEYKYFRKREDRKYGFIHCRKCELIKRKGNEKLRIQYHPNISFKNEIGKDECVCTSCLKIIKKAEAEKGKNTYKCKECYKKINISEGHKRRSKIYRTKRTLTIDEWKDTLLYFNNSCAYCGMTNDESIIKYNKNLTQEHIIPVSLGGDYTKENIIPACLGCNSSKSNKSLDDFYKRKIGVFTKQRYYKIINYIKLVTSKEGA